MSQVSPYIIFLEVKRPDGSRCVCKLSLEPIGGSSTLQVSEWMQLLNSLEEAGYRIPKGGVRVFSPKDQVDEQGS